MDVKKDVKTAGRTLSLFEAFYHRKTPMTLTQLASALNTPISSCHGLVRSGDIKPLHSSAIGKALLGRLDPAALADTLSRLDMARYTPHTNRRQGSAAGRFAVQPVAWRLCYPWRKCRRRHGDYDNHHGQRRSPRHRPGGSSRPHQKGRSRSHGTFAGSAGNARRRGRLTRIW